MIEVKISRDMPLPTPRSVINSPSHMITAVPAVITMTMTRIKKTFWLGINCSLQPVNNCPGVRASDRIAVDCKIASPMVR